MPTIPVFLNAGEKPRKIRMSTPSFKWAKVEKTMVYSPAFQDLTLSARRVLDYVQMQMRIEKIQVNKSTKARYVCTNKDEITIPYVALTNKPFLMANGAITRGIDKLLANGFLHVIEQGGSKKTHVSIYSIGEEWRTWKPGDDPVELRVPYRQRGFTVKISTQKE